MNRALSLAGISAYADIVREMFEQEELVPFLEQHGVALEPAA